MSLRLVTRLSTPEEVGLNRWMLQQSSRGPSHCSNLPCNHGSQTTHTLRHRCRQHVHKSTRPGAAFRRRVFPASLSLSPQADVFERRLSRQQWGRAANQCEVYPAWKNSHATRERENNRSSWSRRNGKHRPSHPVVTSHLISVWMQLRFTYNARLKSCWWNDAAYSSRLWRYKTPPTYCKKASARQLNAPHRSLKCEDTSLWFLSFLLKKGYFSL